MTREGTQAQIWKYTDKLFQRLDVMRLGASREKLVYLIAQSFLFKDTHPS
mgnify:CR=1 FL=1